MVENIKELNEYCQLNNMSVSIEDGVITFELFDYAQPIKLTEDLKIYRWNS